MSKMLNSGDYELLSASLTIPNGIRPLEIDIRGNVIDIVIFESIFDNTMSGNITLFETQNIFDSYDLGHGEGIEISWKTAGMDSNVIEFSGIIYELDGPGEVNGHTSVYTLQFSSREFLEGTRKRSFQGFKATCGNIVKSIFNSMNINPLKPLKPLVVEPTLGIEHIVFTGQTLWQSISLCMSKAASLAKRSGYLFYEDNEKFNFKSIESLVLQEPSVEFKYIDSPVYDNVNNAHEEMFRTIQDYDIVDSNKFIDDIIDGQYGSTVHNINLHNKHVDTYKIKAKTENSIAPRILRSDAYNDQYTDSVDLNYEFNHNAADPYKPYGKLKLLKQDSFALSIGIFGDSSIVVGSTCISEVPKFSSSVGELGETDSFSGKFLIGSVKHILSRETYTQRLLLLKDSFNEI